MYIHACTCTVYQPLITVHALATLQSVQMASTINFHKKYLNNDYITNKKYNHFQYNTVHVHIIMVNRVLLMIVIVSVLHTLEPGFCDAITMDTSTAGPRAV